jgi:hypothetical protein
MKLVRLIKIRLNEIYSKAHILNICLVVFLSKIV